MRLIIQPGFHKTGTTLIQRMLHSADARLRDQGVFDARLAPEAAEIARQLRWDFINFDRKFPKLTAPDTLLARFASLLRIAADQGFDHVVLSDENFLGHPPSFFMQRQGAARFHLTSDHVADLIAEATKGHDVSIFFVVRQQDTLFESHYADGLSWLRFDLSLWDFYQKLIEQGVAQFRIDRKLAYWQEVFGPGRVQVLHYETLTRDPGQFLRQLETVIGLAPETLHLPEKRINPALPGYKVPLARELSRLRAAGEIDVKVAKQRLKQARPEGPADLDLPAPKFTPAQRAEIVATFGDDITYTGYALDGS